MKEVKENENQLKNVNTNNNTRGLRVNTSYLTAPIKIKYNMDQSNLPKGIRSLDDYQKVYDRDINPIINSSVIELKREKAFINRFQDRHPHLKDLSTTEHIKGKYSLIETIYLMIALLLNITKHLTNLNVTLSRDYFRSLQTYLFTSVPQRKQFLSTPLVTLQQVAEMAQQAKSIEEIHSYGVPYEVIFEALDYAVQNKYITEIRYAILIDKFNNTVIVYTILIVGAVSAVGVGIYYLIKYLRSRPPSGSSSSEISVHNAPKDSSSTTEPSKYVSQVIATFRFNKQLLLVGSSILIIALFTLVVEITLLSC